MEISKPFILAVKAPFLLHLYLLGFLLASNQAATQSKKLGLPQIMSYEKQDYSSGPNNWGIDYQGNKTLFANQAGLLVYDGSQWSTHATPLNTVLRSVTVVNDTIWIGGQSELGYFVPDESGNLRYQSITPSFEDKNSNLGEIWDLEYLDGTLYIRSSTTDIYSYHNGTVVKVKNGVNLNKMKAINGELLISSQDDGIYKLRSNHQLELILDQAEFNLTVVNILDTHKGTYFLTENNGLYLYDGNSIKPWQTNIDDYLKGKILRCGIYSDKLGFLLGTKLGGFIQLDQDGRALHVLTKRNGLLSNEINAIALAPDMTIWLASQNGIDRFNFDSGQSLFFPDGELQGAVYDVTKWNGKLLFCTNNGLYTIDDKEYYNPLEDIKFDLIEGTVGQAWGLDRIDGDLLLAHQDGAFQITEDFKAIPILKNTGAWKFVKIENNLIAVGSYTGVYLIEKQNTGWKVKLHVPGLDESCRVMMYDQHHNLWISHPYKKVYKITFSPDYKMSSIKEYDNDDGLNTDNRNYVFEVENDCIVTNETGVYKYANTTDHFERYLPLDTLYLPNVHLKRILPSGHNLYWLIASNGTSLVKRSENDRYETIDGLDNSGIDLSNFIGGFENLYAADSTSLFLCTIKGVNNVSTEEPKTILKSPNFTTITVPSKRDSVVFGGFGDVPTLHLAKDERDIMFEFNSGVEVSSHHHLYTHELEGVDEWSYPSHTQSKEYNNLKHGDYTFRVMSISPSGQYSEPSVIHFNISTPWYLSLVAKAIYALLFFIVLSGLLLIPRQQYQKTTAILETEKKNTEEEMEKLKRETERELEAIKLEKLETEILFKNKELAMSTMHLLQKNQTLTAIRSEVEKNLSKIKDPNAKKEVKKIISLLRSDDRLEDDWSNFSVHFDQAHHNFLKRMKAKYPQLTPKDQKLCAYLRMNLTTKEIAPLLNISVRGVEIARYRLRKKIALEKERNLNDFMMEF